MMIMGKREWFDGYKLRRMMILICWIVGHKDLRWKDGTVCQGSNPCKRCGLWRKIYSASKKAKETRK